MMGATELLEAVEKAIWTRCDAIAQGVESATANEQYNEEVLRQTQRFASSWMVHTT